MRKPQTSRRAAIVLCGGRSRRMGLSKASLPFGPELMLERVVRLIATVAQPIVVVAAGNETPPELPAGVILTHDRRQGRGPLEGLAAGLAALPANTEAAYVTSCDVPLLVPEFVEQMFQQLGPHDIVVPEDGTFRHPLAAVYRPSVLAAIERLLAADRLRPVFLFDEVSTKVVNVEELKEIDPELLTLENLNHPEDYFKALRRVGLPVPPKIAERLRPTGPS